MREQRLRSLAGAARERVSTAELKRGAQLAAVVAGVLGAIVGGRIAMRLAQLALGAARAAGAAARLKLYRRCPDCRRHIRGDARVCWRCGWKRAGRRWPGSRSF